jgi:hypothetical protein
MDLIGFSTGSLARSDVRGALDLLRGQETGAVELSALRANEMQPLLRAIPDLDLAGFARVSVHAPSAFDAADEPVIVEALLSVAERGWPVVAHPDTIRDFEMWRALGSALYIENMDPRKPIGRTAEELLPVFAQLPDALFCLDLAHTRRCDPSLSDALRLLDVFGERLAEVHISELESGNRHIRLSLGAVRAYQRLAPLVPANVPVIIESPVRAEEIPAELEMTRQAMGRTPALV